MRGRMLVTRSFAVVLALGIVLLLACGLHAEDNTTETTLTTSLTSTRRPVEFRSRSTTSFPTDKKIPNSCGTSRKEKRACCLKMVIDFKKNWSFGGKYLQNVFERLKELNCRNIMIPFCKKKIFRRFSDYSRLVYDYHCELHLFQDECKETVALARRKAGYFNSSWSEITEGMNSTEFSTNDLEKPCLQVALYGTPSGGRLYYHETVDLYIPFCDVAWCGFDAKSIEERGLSAWNCMPSWCRSNIIVLSVVCGLLAAAIILANITVIVVFSTSPKLRNSQAIYKISLAFADLLVGVIVLPTCVSSLMILYQSPVSMGAELEKYPQNYEGTLPRRPGGRLQQRFPNGYIDFVGFFTSLSLLVSIYTLMIAGFDRFMAIFRPLRYRHHKAKRIAMWSSLGLWVVAIIFSATPLFVPEMAYGLSASIMVVSLGFQALTLYTVVILVPLILVWVATFATFCATRTHARVRKTMRVRRGSQGTTKNMNMEARLAKTLSAMVGTFTACLLPAVIIIIIGILLPYTSFANTEEVNLRRSKILIAAECVAIILFTTNSLWNCFIYNARSDEFKNRAKDLYARVLSALGFNVLWKRTRSFASSTMRGRRSTVTTSLFSFSMRQQSKFSADLAKTNDEGEGELNANGCNGKYSETNATTGGIIYRYNQGNEDSIDELDQFQPDTLQEHVLTQKDSVIYLTACED